MKNKLKKRIAMLLTVALFTTMNGIPVAASSVSGGVNGYSCAGRNSITSTGASATTEAGSRMRLIVELTYAYTRIADGEQFKASNSNANEPVASITTTCSRPSSAYRSAWCQSKHTAMDGGGIWSHRTDIQYY